jgi:hypothetical protein
MKRVEICILILCCLLIAGPAGAVLIDGFEGDSLGYHPREHPSWAAVGPPWRLDPVLRAAPSPPRRDSSSHT